MQNINAQTFGFSWLYGASKIPLQIDWAVPTFCSFVQLRIKPVTRRHVMGSISRSCTVIAHMLHATLADDASDVNGYLGLKLIVVTPGSYHKVASGRLCNVR